MALDAILNERFALLAGAGLSMAEPSCLPSAWDLAQFAKDAYSARYGADRPALSDDIEEQAEFFFHRSELGTVYLATLINPHAFAGPPNRGHASVADLLLSGAAKFCVTTNVDTMIETAGQQLHGQVGVGLDGHGVAALPAELPPLLKIHGCWQTDRSNTVWAPSQLDAEPVKSMVERSSDWLNQNLLNKDLVIIGYSTDWDYLNLILAHALGAINPSRIIFVNPSGEEGIREKAPDLYAIAARAKIESYFVEVSGNVFLDSLRKEFSRTFVRQAIFHGRAEFQELSGVEPTEAQLEPPDVSNQDFWQMRRDLLGCLPNDPAHRPKPFHDPQIGLTILQLRAAGAESEGSHWRLDDRSVRVIRGSGQFLHKLRASYDANVAPAVYPDIVIAVGAENASLPSSIAREPDGSIARGGSTKWVTRIEAGEELGLN
ncbi:MAG: hypothetical protein GY789_27045 [Hyphomicrobiales bacterium]|nr:hypothetical protein [Hyphomicrobiales bacterium]